LDVSNVDWCIVATGESTSSDADTKRVRAVLYSKHIKLTKLSDCTVGLQLDTAKKTINLFTKIVNSYNPTRKGIEIK